MHHLEIPDIRSCKTILCVQPHPDDTDIGLGATIAMLTQSGARVVYLSVTDDAAGLLGDGAFLPYEERVAIRRREQAEAAAILGVDEVIELGFPDAGPWEILDARLRIVEIINRVRPDALLTVDPWMRYEAHRDHQRAGLAAAEAAILHGFGAIAGDAGGTAATPDASLAPAAATSDWQLRAVGFYFTENPNTHLDVGAWREAKHRALACHASQWDENGYRELLEYDDWRAAQYGQRVAADYAEALLVVPPAWLHIMPDVVALATKGSNV